MWTIWPRGRRKVFISLLLVLLALSLDVTTTVTAAAPATAPTQCPDAILGSCPCYNFADGLFLECSGSSEESLKTALNRVVAHAKPNGECLTYSRFYTSIALLFLFSFFLIANKTFVFLLEATLCNPRIYITSISK